MVDVSVPPIRGPVVDKNGNLTPYMRQWIYDVWQRTGGNDDAVASASSDAESAETTANAAQTTANSAQTSANLARYRSSGVPFVWNSDTSGVAPAGDPTRDLVAVFYDESGSQVATRTLRGTLTSASGTIAVTAVSTTGEATTYSLVDDGTSSVRADIVHTNSGDRTSLAWSFVDESTAGGTPASGGSK